MVGRASLMSFFILAVENSREKIEGTQSDIPVDLQPLVQWYQEVFRNPNLCPQTGLMIIKFPSNHTQNQCETILAQLPAEKRSWETNTRDARIRYHQAKQQPFFIPILLVKNKDGNWWFCIDFRQLNNTTIKHKFPIPLIEDLLDELHEATSVFKIGFTGGLSSNSNALRGCTQDGFSNWCGALRIPSNVPVPLTLFE